MASRTVPGARRRDHGHMDDARDVLAFWSGVFVAAGVALAVGLALLIAVPATIGSGLVAAAAVAAR